MSDGTDAMPDGTSLQDPNHDIKIYVDPHVGQHEFHAERHEAAGRTTPTPDISEANPVNSTVHTAPTLPFPRKKSKDLTDTKYKKFVNLLRSLHINIPFIDALSEMPTYAKYLKEVLAKKRSIP